MAYQLYRNTTLGNSLQESLDELIQSQQITPQLALQVLLQFDKAINAALAQRVRNRVNFRVVQESLDHRFLVPSCDPRTVDGSLCWQLQVLVQDVPTTLTLEVPGLQIQGIYITFQPERKPQSNNGQQAIAAQSPQMMPPAKLLLPPSHLHGMGDQ
uniref:Transcription initiation factor IIA gamma chain n=1 Tax=Bos mutus grunniens TaxID=30521 RepID=A0A8B9WW19_BOSMU